MRGCLPQQNRDLFNTIHRSSKEKTIMRMKRRLYCVLTLVLALSSAGGAGNRRLAYEQAYENSEPRLFQPLPDIVRWIDDDTYLLRLSPEEGSSESAALWKIHAESGKKKLAWDFAVLGRGLPDDVEFNDHIAASNDFEHLLFLSRGDVAYFNTRKQLWKPLTSSVSEEKNPRFSPDFSRVAFTRDHDLYVVEIASGEETRLTHDGSKSIYNGWASWVYYEEVLGRRSRYAAFWWSPDSRMIAFLRFDDSNVPVFPLFRADGVHGDLETAHYPKPGDPNPAVRLGIVHLEDAEIVWVDTDPKADHYVAWPFWTPDSRCLLFQWMNREQNTLRLYSADPREGSKRLLYEEKQKTWVEFFEDISFLQNNRDFLFRSDRSGWMQLYRFIWDENRARLLTPDPWQVQDILLIDNGHDRVFFHGTGLDSRETHLFCVTLDGKELTSLTQTPGTHRCRVSLEGSFFIDVFSDIDHPGEMLLKGATGNTIRSLGTRMSPLLKEYALGKTELFTIPGSDGFDLPARWVLPPDFDPGKSYPVIFAVYGGPGSKNITRSYPRLSHFYLAQEGIIVFSVDHRGSGHFGKTGMDYMHRRLGYWEMQDYIRAVQWLREKPFIDSLRIGIHGGSYGGYVACMALTCGAEYFTHGIADFSVTDWLLYDSIYTERYMDRPIDNPEGYAFGSVMTHADQYRGILLITHGTMDDNVHMQNTLQLVEKLQTLNKDFEMMLYPNCRHGYRPPQGRHARRGQVQFWFRHFFERTFDPESETEM
ncbi:MAG TPA: S9 family peptidase [bacterium]|nr:S9 family peptidase [bacterium]